MTKASISKKPAAKRATTTKKLNLEHKSGFDFLMALLVVSLLFNLFTVCVWLILNITTIYDAQLADIFLSR